MDEVILITGGCGFVGSHLAINIKNSYPHVQVIAMDNLKRRGSELNILRLKESGVLFMHGDIRNSEDFNDVGEITTLIECAAEPSVMSGISSSADYVINTNLQGTINCLNFARKHHAKFIFLSTSRIYPISSLRKVNYTEDNTRFVINTNQDMPGISERGISENFPLQGARSFYGASKLASELMIEEFGEFYGLRAIINRCGIISGPWQMGKIDQGVIVLWMARHYWKGDLSYLGFGGTGKQVRDLIHIQDIFELLQEQLLNFDLFQGKVFNVGGGLSNSVSLKELTTLCEEITGNKIQIQSVSETQPADIPIYITDNAKLHNLNGWIPQRNTSQILKDVYNWISNNEIALQPLLNK